MKKMRPAVKRRKPQRSRPFSLWRRGRQFLAKRLRLLFLSFFLVLGTALVFAGLYLFQLLHQNLSLAGNGLWSSTTDLETNQSFNLLFFSLQDISDPVAEIKSAALVNFQPAASLANVFLLSTSARLSLPGVGEAVSLNSLYGLAQLKKGRPGGFNLGHAFSLTLGVPLAGLVYFDEAGKETLSHRLGLKRVEDLSRSGRVDHLFSVLKTLSSLGPSLRTDLSARSLLRLGIFLSFNFPPGLEVYDLERVLADRLTLDAFWRPKIIDAKVRAERQSLIILNATKTSGLASAAARLAANLGLSVLSTDNSAESHEVQATALYADSENSLSVRSLARALGLLEIRSFESLANQPSYQRWRRADLVLILGRDAIFEK